MTESDGIPSNGNVDDRCVYCGYKATGCKCNDCLCSNIPDRDCPQHGNTGMDEYPEIIADQQRKEGL